MSKINVVYWSMTGNTKAMAEAIADGVKSAGAEVVNGEGTICEEAPDDTTVKELNELGKKLASL